MAELTYKITSILGGQSPLYHGAGEGQFLTSIAIDPEVTISSTASGNIYPIGYSKFSSNVPSGAPMWIITNSVNSNVYVYATDGEFFSYTSTLGSETLIGTPTSGAGNGGIYYNDYIYLMTPTDVSRYGPLSSTATLTNTVWTGVTLGSQTATTNTTYPGDHNVNYPNHAAHLHSDGAVYFLDYANGQGMVHKIKTTNTGTNNGSAYNVLDLPFGVIPFDIESYGTDLVIIGTEMGSATNVKQGRSYLFLWDTMSDSFYAQIPLPTALATAVVNKEGVLYIWGGSIGFGWQLFKYSGGYDVELVWDSRDGSPPYSSAVDAYGDRVAWGTYLTTPSAVGCVMTHGYQNTKLGTDAIHNIAVADTTDTLPTISALKFTQQAQTAKKPIIGWRTDSAATYGLSKLTSSGTKNSIFRTQVFVVDTPFTVKKLSLNLTGSVDANTIITPKIYYDDAGTSKTLNVINSTNYPNAYSVTYKALEIDQAVTAGYIGYNNFFIEIAFTGTSDIGIALPIEIVVETREE